jgi:predicted  nucleic acid-binding Zn-ribbon protein
MYTCERCGTRFGRPSAVLESCPRCLARDGARVALTFRLFDESADEAKARATAGGSEAAVRSRMASTAPDHRRIIDPADIRGLPPEARDAA